MSARDTSTSDPDRREILLGLSGFNLGRHESDRDGRSRRPVVLSDVSPGPAENNSSGRRDIRMERRRNQLSARNHFKVGSADKLPGPGNHSSGRMQSSSFLSLSARWLWPTISERLGSGDGLMGCK